jgi:hypothetical protein
MAIVGNSINLVNNERGKDIDSHSDVIRFNKIARVDGFELYCGSKNNIRICSYIALSCKKPNNHPIINNTVYDLDKVLSNCNLLVFYKKKMKANKNRIYYLKWNTILLWY